MFRLEKLENRQLLDALPVGPEFRVNTITLTGQGEPSVANSADGDFVVAWSGGQDEPNGRAVYAQRYNAAGVPQGGEFRVSPDTPQVDTQYDPSVAMDVDGDFVVAWSDGETPQSGSAVYARRYDSGGASLGEPIRVHTGTVASQTLPDVAMDGAGDFVVTWYEYASVSRTVMARPFAADGTPRSDAYPVGTGVWASVAMDGDGDFVVAWTGYREPFEREIDARRFDASGAPLGETFQVNTFTTSSQTFPAVAMDADGDFVVTWNSDRGGKIYGIYARRYDAAGMPQGDEFAVNTFTAGNQWMPTVATDVDGDAVIAWASSGQDGSGYGVYAQLFDAAGARDGGEFRINSSTANNQTNPAVAMDADGEFIVAWASGHSSSGDIYAQRFAQARAPAVTASSFLFDTAPQRLTFTFDRDVSGSLTLEDLVVQTQPGGAVVSPSGISYDATTNTATVTFDETLPDGQYRATLSAAGVTSAAGVPMAADHVLDFFFLNGDANRDARVNLEDFNLLAANFGQSGRTFSQGDFTYDGTVNLQDFNLLASRFGQSVSAAAGAGQVGGANFDDEGDELLA